MELGNSGFSEEEINLINAILSDPCAKSLELELVDDKSAYPSSCTSGGTVWINGALLEIASGSDTGFQAFLATLGHEKSHYIKGFFSHARFRGTWEEMTMDLCARTGHGFVLGSRIIRDLINLTRIIHIKKSLLLYISKLEPIEVPIIHRKLCFLKRDRFKSCMDEIFADLNGISIVKKYLPDLNVEAIADLKNSEVWSEPEWEDMEHPTYEFRSSVMKKGEFTTDTVTALLKEVGLPSNDKTYGITLRRFPEVCEEKRKGVT